MTVPSAPRSAGPFVGNGVTTAFPFTFKVFSADDVAVYYTDSAGTQSLLTTNYTVALNADQDATPGGTVTYPTAGAALSALEQLALVGDLAYVQGTDITNAGRFLAQVVENVFDYLTILAQQLLEKLGRTLSYPVGDSGSTTLPTVAVRAGNFLAFDASGNPIAAAGTTATPVSAFMATVLDDTTAGAARTTLGAGATGSTLFTAATAAAARGTLGSGATGDALFLTATALAARAATGAAGHSWVRGLTGLNNSITPLTKYDLAADAVTLRDANGALATQLNTATLTCDLGLAGSAANGRDQAAAFAISQWIYLYFIWNGATLATLASTTAPSAFAGATLPAGYTHWAFATALRWNASSNLIPTRTRGKTVWYQLDNNGAANRALSNGQSTAFAAVSLASLIPPNALMADLLAIISGTHNVPSASFIAQFRPTGSGLTFGINAADVTCQINGVSFETSSRCLIPPGTTSQIDYKMSTASATMGVYIDVSGYTIPNGDS